MVTGIARYIRMCFHAMMADELIWLLTLDCNLPSMEGVRLSWFVGQAALSISIL